MGVEEFVAEVVSLLGFVFIAAPVVIAAVVMMTKQRNGPTGDVTF